MKSLFFQRYIAVVILFTFVSLSGCAYHKHMNKEKENSVRIKEKIKRAGESKHILESQKKALEVQISNMNEEIIKLERQEDELQKEINKLKKKKAKTVSEINQLKKQNAEIKKLKGKIKTKKGNVKSKRAELESYSY